MSKWFAFQYREFWDQPRILYTSDEEQSFLFDCPFDERLGGYAESYNVYLMPWVDPSELSGSWAGLEQKALRLLGTVRLPLSALDPSRRAQIDLDILSQLIPALGDRDAP
jgi:hypothetical protein